MITALPLRRSLAALSGALLVSAGAFSLFAPGASAAGAQEIDDASFSWSINSESGGGAYFGGCNFLVAGDVGNLQSSHVWTAAEGAEVYRTAVGDVTITKPDADGNQVEPTWDTKCKDANGSTVNTSASSSTWNQVNFSDGSGTVDADAGTAEISWDGTASVVYYGGMTYWTFSNPVLTIEDDGTGTLTATAGGYGADMYDTSKWVQLPATEITLANFTDAEVTADGFTATPEYLGVEVNTDGGMSPQSTTGANWGSFPQDFVEFQILTGQSSYWYSSGGMADARKPASPATFAWTTAAEEPPTEEPPVEEPPTEEPPVEEETGEEAGDVDVTVNVPESSNSGGGDNGDGDGDGDGGDGDGGDGGTTEPEFTVTVSSDSASLGTAEANEAGFAATGALPSVTVKDTFTEDNAFSVVARASDFTSTADSFSAASLGWTPAGSGEITEAVVGAPVEANNPGLKKSATLVSAPEGHAAGEITVGADLALQAPADTPAGAYTSTITITTIR